MTTRFDDLSGQVILITEACRGLGRAIASHLAMRGADLIVTFGTSRDSPDETVQAIESLGRKVVPVRLDLGVSEAFSAFTDEMSLVLRRTWDRNDLDGMVGHAPTSHSARIDAMSETDFDELFRVQLKGTFLLTQKVAPLIRDGGRIVNMSSALTRSVFAGQGGYAAMKGGLEVLSQYLAQELGPRGITVNIVAPGIINSEYSGATWTDKPAFNKHIGGMTALGKAGTPDDIAPVVATFFSDSHRWVTGQRIEVSGGFGL